MRPGQFRSLPSSSSSSFLSRHKRKVVICEEEIFSLLSPSTPLPSDSLPWPLGLLSLPKQSRGGGGGAKGSVHTKKEMRINFPRRCTLTLFLESLLVNCPEKKSREQKEANFFLPSEKVKKAMAKENYFHFFFSYRLTGESSFSHPFAIFPFQVEMSNTFWPRYRLGSFCNCTMHMVLQFADC